MKILKEFFLEIFVYTKGKTQMMKTTKKVIKLFQLLVKFLRHILEFYHI